MGFRTLRLEETASELKWDIYWDGDLRDAVLAESPASWVAVIALITSPPVPEPGVSREVRFVAVLSRHKLGPHPQDGEDARAFVGTLEPLDILSESSVNDIERATKTVDHPAGGPVHHDSYRLMTARLHDEDGVTIKLRASHVAPGSEKERY